MLAYEPAARALLGMAIATGFLAATLSVAAAWLMSQTIAGVFLERLTPEAIGPLLIGLALLAVGRAVGLWLTEVLAQRAANKLKGRLRGDLTGRLFLLGPARLEDRRTGELSSVMTDGLDAIDPWLTSYQPARAMAVLVPILVLVVVLVVDPLSALVLVVTGPVLLLLLAIIGGRTRLLSERRFAELRWLSGFFLELLRGLPTLRMFGRSTEQVDNLRTINTRFSETTMDVLRSAFQTGLVLDWGGAVAMALVAVQVSLRLMADAIPFDRALAVLIVTPEFFLPLRQLAARYHAGSAGRAAAAGILALLDEPSPARTPVVAPTAMRTPVRPDRPADIRFDGVTVRFPGRARAALEDVTLEIAAGRRTAIVGATGAGKTTIARLLLRFVDPDAGSILVGGTPLVDLDPEAWRARVAWVPQAPHLFHGTVADNLRLARPGATSAELAAALKAAQAAAFVSDLPDGPDTPIGEGGIRLSGGERQRLAIARALLRDAPLLVLDEPTAHLDRDSEAAVAATIERLAGPRTVLVITHRLTLAETADRVAVLDGGRLVELGTADELRARGEAFARLEAAAREAPAA